ncbi:MAG: glycosyltransferase [Treponema sp.]|nr:glycosyltransferase [Treponema sp.]
MVDLTDSSIPNEDKLAFTFLSSIKSCCFRKWPCGTYNPPKSKDISILIPCYGKADTIEKTVQSAAKQTLKAYKILILLMDIDSQKKKEILEILSDNIECVFSERLNVCAARNKLAELCPTEYFVFLDADDELADNFLEVCYNEEASVVFPAQVFTKEALERKEFLDGDANFSREERKENFFINQNFTCLFHKTAFKELGGFNERYKDGFEDTDIMLRLLDQQKYKISTTLDTKSLYKECPNGLTKKQPFFDSMFEALNEWLPVIQKKYKETPFFIDKEVGDFMMSLEVPVKKESLHSFFNGLAGLEINSLKGGSIPYYIMGDLINRNSRKVVASFVLDLKCNKNCEYCCQKKEREGVRFLTEDEMFFNFDKALTKCESLIGHHPQVQLLGGEPTLWSDGLVSKIQKRLAQYDDYHVFTNGFNKNSLLWNDHKAVLHCHITDWTNCERISGLPETAIIKLVVTKKDIHLLDSFLSANSDLSNNIILLSCHGAGKEYDLDIDDIKTLANIEWEWRKLFPLENRINLNWYETYREKGLEYCQACCKKYKTVWNFNCYNNTVSPCCMAKNSYSLENFYGQKVESCGDCMFFF